MNNGRVLVIGYYSRRNFGDDVFEYVLINYFKNRFPSLEYSFISIDDLKEIPQDTSAVIFGGGDLVNDYFYRKIRPFINNKTCPWYAISIGIPYPKLVDEGYLDRFDYIIHRNKFDTHLLDNRYNQLNDNKINRSEWFPDMSFMLTKFHNNTNTNNNNFIEYTDNNKYNSKKIGVCLSRNIYNKDDPDSYNNIVNTIAKFLSKISLTHRKTYIPSCGKVQVPLYELYLIPFCTDGKDNHDDRLINQDLYDKISEYGHINNIHLITEELSMDKIIPIFNSFHLTICTRFHAHMFSVMTKTPIMSIYSTRKVEGLIKELKAIEYSCKFDIHPEKDYPIDIDYDKLMGTFLNLEKTYDNYIIKMETLHNKYTTKTNEFMDKLDNLLTYVPRFVLADEIDNNALNITRTIDRKLNTIYNNNHDNNNHHNHNNHHNNNHHNHNHNRGYIKGNIVNEITDNGVILKYFRHYSEETKDMIVELISYELTGNRYSDYYYGLYQQVFTEDYNLYESCKWILHHKNKITKGENYEFITNSKYNLNDRKLNMTFYNNKIFDGYHRSGWTYVLEHMKELHNPNGVILDSYLDKTFGWEYDFLSTNGLLPYTNPWIGFFHHTPDQDYTDNNLVVSFSRPHFISSLKYCKGLITLSKNNKKWITHKLNEINVDNIPVISLIHPTEIISDELEFDIKAFKRAPERKIIQIGAWLRDSYAIYDLSVPEEYRKFALKGKDMNNYFINTEELNSIEKYAKSVACGRKHRTSGCVVPNKDANKYIVGMISMLHNNHNSVQIIENINNDEYDELLKSGIVFIKLVDASAVNTILECIVRNTPILVNRLPATEEYLGKDYPLFYDNMDHATDLLKNFKNIKRGYKYLCKMNKKKFDVTWFLDSLVNSSIYRHL